MSHEECCFCGAETGRAGASEDSIFFGNVGPFCEECAESIESESEVVRLRAELDEARKDTARLQWWAGHRYVDADGAMGVVGQQLDETPIENIRRGIDRLMGSAAMGEKP